MKTLVAALAFAQFVVPFGPRLLGWGQDIGRRASENGLPSPETPAGYAFSIWFPIFVLGIVYAIRLWRAPADTRLAPLAPFAAAMFAAGTAWMLWTQLVGSSVVQLATIYAMYAATMLGAARVASGDRPSAALFGLQGGWLTAAICLNTTSYVREFAGATPFGLTPETYALFTLVPATLLALATILARRANAWFAGAFAWALIGVAAANLAGENDLRDLALGALLAVLAAHFAARGKERTP